MLLKPGVIGPIAERQRDVAERLRLGNMGDAAERAWRASSPDLMADSSHLQPGC